MSNDVRKSGEVELEEDTEGFTETGTEREGNERREDEGILMYKETEPELEDDNILGLEDRSGEVEEAVGGLEGITEELENGNEFGDDDEGVEGNPKEV